MKLNIGIIGSGSAAAVCALGIINTFMGYHHKISSPLDFKVLVISNPNIPKISVGESMSPMLFDILRKSLLINNIQQYEEMEIIFRYGARHTWENNQNTKFDVDYLNGGNFPGAHMSSEKFSDFVFKQINLLLGDDKLIKIHDNIKHISQNDNVALAHGENNIYSFDYIFDCRGFPTKEELNSGKYNFSEFQTVNSVLLFRHEKEYNHQYSEVLFHKNGWQFGINTRNSKAFGYLYNKDITDKEEALKHFKELNKNIPIDNVKELYWPSYSVKKVVDGRIICMGNKLYFYEPIQGIPLHMYYNFCRYIMFRVLNFPFTDEIKSRIEEFSDVNLPFEELYNTLCTNITKRFYEIILTNYIGNTMNSEFWIKTSYKSRQYLLKSTQWIDFCHKYVDYKNNKAQYPGYFPHPNSVMKQYLEGLNVRPEKFINGEYLAPK